MPSIEFDYIASNSALADWFHRLQGQTIVALDTEFHRETTYFPIPALIQIKCGDAIALIDPTAIDNYQPLSDMLCNSGVLKIMHSCEEDLEVFRQLCGVLPSPLFDTQIGAAFAGLGYSMSYSRLVNHFSGHQLDKSETRSNWLQRPLSAAQLDYAVADVEWLFPIYEQLREMLSQQGREQWCEQENERLIGQGTVPAGPESAYARFRSAWRFNQQDLVRLQKICEWREREAMAEDVPRGRVLADAAIVELLNMRPTTMSQIARVNGIGSYTQRKYGEVLVAMANLAVDSSDYLPKMPDKRAPEFRRQIKAMQQIVKNVADACQLPIELLGKKRDLENYLLNRQDSLIANSWRRELLVDELERAIAS